jgi:hypothetical protein
MGIRPWGFSGVGLGGHAWCGALAPAGVVLGTGSGPGVSSPAGWVKLGSTQLPTARSALVLWLLAYYRFP